MSERQMPTAPQADEAAKANDVEQRTGHGGNLRDGGPGAEAPMPRPVVGNSAHIPHLEEIDPLIDNEQTASPGADADRQAGQ